MRSLKLTGTSVIKLESEAAEYFVWDTELSGFGIRVYPTGRKVLVAQVRVGNRQRRVTIGKLGKITVDQARVQAKIVISGATLGIDPGKKPQDKLTLRQCFEEWLEKKAPINRKTGATRPANSVANDKSRMTLHVLPKIGHLPLKQIERHHVEEVLAAANTKSAHTHRPSGRGFIGKTGGLAAGKRTVATLKSVLNYAVDRGWIDRNPAIGVALKADKQRLTYLTVDETNALIALINQGKSASTDHLFLDSVLLILYTGCRKSEILSLRWDEVEIPQKVLSLSTGKTGARKVPLNSHAISVLHSIPKTSSPFVFPSPIKLGDHYKSPGRGWKRLREKIGRSDCDLHSLRHTYASLLIAAGADLVTVGKLLGHRKIQTTMIYVHLVDQQVSEANESAVKALLGPLETLATDSENPKGRKERNNGETNP